MSRPGRAGARFAVAVALAAALGIVTALPGAVPASGRAAPIDDRTAAEKAPSGGWWDDRVFYEVFVRSFADADGDGIGDLRGATAKLDYLKAVGVGAVWLMPVTESSAYHGYTVTDYRAVEKDYGTLDDMRAYLARARQLDIKVIVDLVVNHTGDQHPWFVESQRPRSAKATWYRWSARDSAERGPWGQQVWHRAGNGRYYFGLFDRSQPDLNLANPAVTKELVDIARFWLVDVGVDGFRLDAASHLVESGSVMENTSATKAWWRSFRRQVKAIEPDAFLVGEVNGPARPAATYVPDGLDATFQFDLAKGFVRAVRDQNGAALTAEQLFGDSLYGPGAQYASFLSNHDQNRFAGQVGSLERARLGAAEQLTRPGIPFLYYGEEVGLLGNKPDEAIRTPMPWTADPGGGFTTATATPWEPFAPGREQGRTVAAQDGVSGSLLEAYRALIGLRNREPALRAKGSWERIPAVARTTGTAGGVPLGLSASLRSLGGRRLLVVNNLGATPITALGGDPAPVELVMTVPSAPTGPAVSGATVALALGWPSVAAPSVAAVAGGTEIRVAGPIPASATLVLSLS